MPSGRATLRCPHLSPRIRDKDPAKKTPDAQVEGDLNIGLIAASLAQVEGDLRISGCSGQLQLYASFLPRQVIGQRTGLSWTNPQTPCGRRMITLSGNARDAAARRTRAPMFPNSRPRRRDDARARLRPIPVAPTSPAAPIAGCTQHPISEMPVRRTPPNGTLTRPRPVFLPWRCQAARP